MIPGFRGNLPDPPSERCFQSSFLNDSFTFSVAFTFSNFSIHLASFVRIQLILLCFLITYDCTAFMLIYLCLVLDFMKLLRMFLLPIIGYSMLPTMQLINFFSLHSNKEATSILLIFSFAVYVCRLRFTAYTLQYGFYAREFFEL